jgi:hypothetical protein
MNKSELLDWLLVEYQQWEAFLDRIGEARMDQGGVNGHWSIKDIVAHLTGWNRHLIARLKAAQRGEPEPPPPWPVHLQTEDAINGWIYESNRGCSVREVLDESHQVFQQLLAVIEGLPDEVRIDPVHQGEEFIFLCGWTVSASPLVNSLTISMMTMSQTYAPGSRVWKNNRCSMNIIIWKTIIWQQFGAAIDMLDNALRACPDELWRDRLWENSTRWPEFSQFWYLVYHALFWLDLYLTGAEEGFVPPAPFTPIEQDEEGPMPERPYTKDELQAYLAYCRQKCQATIEALTDETAQRRCSFGWARSVSRSYNSIACAMCRSMPHS